MPWSTLPICLAGLQPAPRYADITDSMTFDPQRGLSRRAHWAGGDKMISRLMAEALARPDLVSLAAGFVDQVTLPVEATREALEAVWSDPARARAALQYG